MALVFLTKVELRCGLFNENSKKPGKSPAFPFQLAV
jgi:hypothetical protein